MVTPDTKLTHVTTSNALLTMKRGSVITIQTNPESMNEVEARWITQNKEIQNDANNPRAYGHRILGRW